MAAAVVLVLANVALLASARLAATGADDDTRSRSQTAQAIAGADASTAAAAAEQDALAAQARSAEQDIAAYRQRLDAATLARDDLREQLEVMQAELAAISQQLDESFSDIVGNHDVIEHLRGCFYGVNRALNLASLGRDDDAAVAVLEVSLQCANAQSALANGANG